MISPPPVCGIPDGFGSDGGGGGGSAGSRLAFMVKQVYGTQALDGRADAAAPRCHFREVPARPPSIRGAAPHTPSEAKQGSREADCCVVRGAARPTDAAAPRSHFRRYRPPALDPWGCVPHRSEAREGTANWTMQPVPGGENDEATRECGPLRPERAQVLMNPGRRLLGVGDGGDHEVCAVDGVSAGEDVGDVGAVRDGVDTYQVPAVGLDRGR